MKKLETGNSNKRLISKWEGAVTLSHTDKEERRVNLVPANEIPFPGHFQDSFKEHECCL